MQAAATLAAWVAASLAGCSRHFYHPPASDDTGDGSDCASDPEGALASAAAGDTIRICSGTWPANLAIGAEVRIVGEGTSLTCEATASSCTVTGR